VIEGNSTRLQTESFLPFLVLRTHRDAFWSTTSSRPGGSSPSRRRWPAAQWAPSYQKAKGHPCVCLVSVAEGKGKALSPHHT
jgi:hypothetical protein